MEYYPLNEPMTWKTYKAMPDDLKAEYISGLAKKYHCGQQSLADMFGVSKSSICREVSRLKCWPFEPGQNHPSGKDVRAWNEFLGVNELEQVSPPPIEPAPKAEPKADGRINTVLTCGELTLSGQVSDVMARLESILGGDNRYTLTVKFEEVA